MADRRATGSNHSANGSKLSARNKQALHLLIVAQKPLRQARTHGQQGPQRAPVVHVELAARQLPRCTHTTTRECQQTTTPSGRNAAGHRGSRADDTTAGTEQRTRTAQPAAEPTRPLSAVIGPSSSATYTSNTLSDTLPERPDLRASSTSSKATTRAHAVQEHFPPVAICRCQPSRAERPRASARPRTPGGSHNETNEQGMVGWGPRNRQEASSSSKTSAAKQASTQDLTWRNWSHSARTCTPKARELHATREAKHTQHRKQQKARTARAQSTTRHRQLVKPAAQAASAGRPQSTTHHGRLVKPAAQAASACRPHQHDQ